MRKQILTGLTGWMLALSAMASQELALALKDTPAPDQEYVRTPAKYIFQKLSNTAHRSGNPALSSFKIDIELAGCDNVKVSINLADLTLLEALQEVAKSTGAGIEFGERHITLKDPSLTTELVLEEPAEEPVLADTTTEEPDRKRSRKDEPEVAFSDVSHAIIFVENGDGRGSAFIAEMDGKTYVFSNQHNFLGAKRIIMRTMRGTILKPNLFEYSRTHDLVRLLLDEKDIEGLSVLKLSSEIPNIDEKIVIFGNSAGGGVATELEGEIIGVGPADIEITAKMVPGNSGSPILNNKSEVVGVATYATLGQKFDRGSSYDKMFKGTRFAKVRRYGVRIPETGWVSDNLNFFLRQTYRQEDMKTFMLAIYALHQYWIGKTDSSLVNRMFDSYGSIGSSTTPPFKFKMKENEEILKQVVRSFVLNHREMERRATQLSTGRREDEIGRMKKILTTGLEDMRETIDDTYWKTNLLKKDARELKEISEEIINQIKETKDPYSKKKR
ncbi:serine protease [Pontiellaceae bacterium B12227]|nr:serine protease [Pontiellaceae bacterium B12227]